MFRANHGADQIRDFADDGLEKIAFINTGLAFGDLTITNIGGGDAQVDYGTGTITVENTIAASLDVDDFDFV